MAKFEKQAILRGTWIKPAKLSTGMQVEIISEVKPIKSRFRDDSGEIKMQNVGSIQLLDKDGKSDPTNVYLFRFNGTTVDGLITAFGDDSETWIGEKVTVQKEKTLVAGRKKEAIYLIPDGMQLVEDEEGYMHIESLSTSD